MPKSGQLEPQTCGGIWTHVRRVPADSVLILTYVNSGNVTI